MQPCTSCVGPTSCSACCIATPHPEPVQSPNILTLAPHLTICVILQASRCTLSGARPAARASMALTTSAPRCGVPCSCACFYLFWNHVPGLDLTHGVMLPATAVLPAFCFGGIAIICRLNGMCTILAQSAPVILSNVTPCDCGHTQAVNTTCQCTWEGDLECDYGYLRTSESDAFFVIGFVLFAVHLVLDTHLPPYVRMSQFCSSSLALWRDAELWHTHICDCLCILKCAAVADVSSARMRCGWPRLMLGCDFKAAALSLWFLMLPSTVLVPFCAACHIIRFFMSHTVSYTALKVLTSSTPQNEVAWQAFVRHVGSRMQHTHMLFPTRFICQDCGHTSPRWWSHYPMSLSHSNHSSCLPRNLHVS